MPKNPVNDPITDQEIVFARLVLSGAVTDRQAAETAGLNPDTAAYTKAKPRVRAWMLEHRAALDAQLLQQEAAKAQRRDLCRERVLARLWKIADLETEKTRNSAAIQMKALAMIVALEELLPDRRAERSEKKPLPVVNVYQSAWIREQEQKNAQASPDVTDDSPAQGTEDVPPDMADNLTPRAKDEVLTEGADNPLAVEQDSVQQGSGVPATPSVQPVTPVQAIPSWPYGRLPDTAPDKRQPFRIPVNPFKPRRPYR